jgi:three-Cys-motif partner protein
VSVPEETIWDLQPHTAAKHQILRRYLDAWFPILAKYNSRIVYVDGFSGPGRYSGGEPGSPIIALESARTHRANLAGELVFLFVEERQDRIDNLNREISGIQLPAHFKVDVECGTFAENLTAKLNKLDADGHQIAPTFALISKTYTNNNSAKWLSSSAILKCAIPTTVWCTISFSHRIVPGAT